MDINRDLCSLKNKKKKLQVIYRTPQNSKFEKNTINPMAILYGNSLELLSVEPNILVVSWRQICDNSLATKVWGGGGQIFFKENDMVPPSYLFSVCLLC